MKKVSFIRVALSMPFKILATVFGMLMMLFVMCYALTRGVSFDEFIDKSDKLMDGLESQVKKDF